MPEPVFSAAADTYEWRYRAGASNKHAFTASQAITGRTRALCSARSAARSLARDAVGNWLGGPGEGVKAERSREKLAGLKPCLRCTKEIAHHAEQALRPRPRMAAVYDYGDYDSYGWGYE